jgi:hypothetical protein
MNCDPLVEAMNFYGLVDEPDLDRFQAGLMRADWTKRASYHAVKRAIAQAQNGCQGQLADWRHVESVIGAGADFGKLRVQTVKQTWWGFAATAREDATYSAGVYRVQSRTISDSSRTEIARSLAGQAGRKPALRKKSTIKAYWSPIVRFPARRLERGIYVYAIRISAAMNPGRANVFVSRPFQVGK